MWNRPLYYHLIDGEIVPAPDDPKRIFQTNQERMIARTVFPGQERTILVSTVFLNIDHVFGDGPPVLFETMIFAPGHDLDLAQWRYSSLADATEGHQHAVKLVTAALDDQKQTLDPLEQTVADMENHLNGSRSPE